METEAEVMDQEETRAWLVRMGLARPCSYCPPIRAWVKTKPIGSNDVHLVGHTLEMEPPTGPYRDRLVVGDLKIQCGSCKNTGVVPTNDGLMLIAFVLTFQDRAGTNRRCDQPG